MNYNIRLDGLDKHFFTGRMSGGRHLEKGLIVNHSTEKIISIYIRCDQLISSSFFFGMLRKLGKNVCLAGSKVNLLINGDNCLEGITCYKELCRCVKRMNTLGWDLKMVEK